MSNNFDTPVLLDAGTGTPAAPASYFGFTRAAGAAVSTGARIYHGTGDPNGVLTAPAGSIWLRDNGIASINTDSGTTWVQLGTLAGAVILTSIDSTATANFDWDLAAGSATALGFDDGGVTLFGIDTNANVNYVGGTASLRLNDNAALTFGTPGTDMVCTADGAGVTVTATGTWDWQDDVQQNFGTGDDFSMEYQNAGNIWVVAGLDVVAGGAAAATGAIRVDTGDRTVNDAAGSPASGIITIETGDTDCTNGGGTGGASGALNLLTGDAASTAGTSGASGAIVIQSGTSADVATGNVSLVTGAAAAGNSGNIVLTTGAAGGVQGILDINAAEISLATQATDIEIIDNTASALRIGQVCGTNDYLAITTTNGTETITIGNQNTLPDVNFDTPGMIECNSVDFTDRLVLTERFYRRPAIQADIANDSANKVMAAGGTNMTSALCTFIAGGGLQLQTAGALNDQAIIYGEQTAGQSIWHSTTWLSSMEPIFKFNCRGSDTANIRVQGGCQLTTALDDTTDAQKIIVRFDSSDGVTSAVNWVVCSSAGGVDALEDTGVAYTNNVNYRIVISVSAARQCSVFINGALVSTPATHTLAAATDLGEPMFGIQALNASQRVAELQCMGASQNYT